MLLKTENGVRIDATRVEVGAYVPAEEIEAATGLSRTTSEYAFVVLRLAQQLEVDLEAAGRPAMVRGEDRGLRVMTADEAADYTDRRFRSALRQAEAVHRRMSVVAATSTLAADVRERYDRQANIRARMLQSIAGDLAAAEQIAALGPRVEE